MKNPKQLDLFSKIPTWKKRGFATEEEFKKALEFDRAWRHMEQHNSVMMKRGLKKCK
jgi:hemerythrin